MLLTKSVIILLIVVAAIAAQTSKIENKPTPLPTDVKPTTPPPGGKPVHMPKNKLSCPRLPYVQHNDQLFIYLEGNNRSTCNLLVYLKETVLPAALPFFPFPRRTFVLNADLRNLRPAPSGRPTVGCSPFRMKIHNNVLTIETVRGDNPCYMNVAPQIVRVPHPTQVKQLVNKKTQSQNRHSTPGKPTPQQPTPRQPTLSPQTNQGFRLMLVYLIQIHGPSKNGQTQQA